MKDGFYVGIFHNDEGIYIDSVRVTGKPEVFEIINNYTYRIDDMYVYQYIDFFNPILLDEAPDIQPFVKGSLWEGYCWAVLTYSIKWEVIQVIKGSKNQFGFKKMGVEGGLFDLARIKHLGPLIDLKTRRIAVEADKT